MAAPQRQKQEWARRYAESVNNRAVQVATLNTPANVETALNLYLSAFEVQLALLDQNAADISRAVLADSRLSGQQLRARLQQLVERYGATSAETGIQRSRVVRNDAAQTLINVANSCLDMGFQEYESNRIESMDWYRLALLVSRKARTGYDSLVRDFPSIPDYPLRQSASMLTEVAASFADEKNDLQELIGITEQQIEICNGLVSRFRGSQSELKTEIDRVLNSWIGLRDEMQKTL